MRPVFLYLIIGAYYSSLRNRSYSGPIFLSASVFASTKSFPFFRRGGIFNFRCAIGRNGATGTSRGKIFRTIGGSVSTLR